MSTDGLSRPASFQRCTAISPTPAAGVEVFLERIRAELLSGEYRPMRNRRKAIPKDGGKKVRVLGIPAVRDRVVQGAPKLILEPIFEADFQAESYGYRPKRVRLTCPGGFPP